MTFRQELGASLVDPGEVDDVQRKGATAGGAEIKALKTKVRRLEEDNAILKCATHFFVGKLYPEPLIVGLIDTMRAEGHAAESICRVMLQQGRQIAARTYRNGTQVGRPVAARTVSDTHVVNAMREIAR